MDNQTIALSATNIGDRANESAERGTAVKYLVDAKSPLTLS
jgi:hypothetical protein